MLFGYKYTKVNYVFLLNVLFFILQRFSEVNYQTKVDDVEYTSIRGAYDGVLVVLVLQHVEWQRALESLLGLSPKKLYVIEQDN